MTAAQFKTDLCNRVSVLMSCDGIDIDVTYYAAGTTVTLTGPLGGGGTYDGRGLGGAPALGPTR